MSKRYPGGLITKTPVVPTISAAPGIWTLDQAITYIKAGTWPIVPISGPYWIGILTGSFNQGFGITVDSAGNSYVSGTNPNFQTAKYNTSGVIQWQRSLTSTGNSVRGDAVAVDSSGNAYFTGFIQIPSSGNIYAQIAKYNSSGTIQWQKRLGSSANTTRASGAAIDSSGNLYICGPGSITGTEGDFLIAKYDANSGAVIWQRTLGDTTNSQFGTSIVVDSFDNVYIAGYSFVGSDVEGTIAKYNTSGTIQWQRRITGTFIQINSIAVDSFGNIYGSGVKSNGSDSNALLVKFNAYGTLVWQRILYGPSLQAQAFGVETDSLGNVYVCGYLDTGVTALIFKYNGSGILQWQRSISTSGNDVAYSVDVDPFGNLYVTGTTTVSGTNNILIAKLPSDGSLTGTYTVGGYSITYAASTLSEVTSGASSSASSLTDAPSSFTESTTTNTDAATTLTSSVTTI
jgi:uncharacterized delta-60 repeat protein